MAAIVAAGELLAEFVAAKRGQARSRSGSVTNGIIGATLTPTGTPASRNARIVRSLRAGVAARGSSARASSGSSVVIVTAAITCRRSAIGTSRSRSRSISDDFVIAANG